MEIIRKENNFLSRRPVWRLYWKSIGLLCRGQKLHSVLESGAALVAGEWTGNGTAGAHYCEVSWSRFLKGRSLTDLEHELTAGKHFKLSSQLLLFHLAFPKLDFDTTFYE